MVSAVTLGLREVASLAQDADFTKCLESCKIEVLAKAAISESP